MERRQRAACLLLMLLLTMVGQCPSSAAEEGEETKHGDGNPGGWQATPDGEADAFGIVRVRSAASALRLLRSPVWVLFVSTSAANDAAWLFAREAAELAQLMGEESIGVHIIVAAVDLSDLSPSERPFAEEIFAGGVPGAARLYACQGPAGPPSSGAALPLWLKESACCRPSFRGEVLVEYLGICFQRCIAPQETLQRLMAEDEMYACSLDLLEDFVASAETVMVGMYEAEGTQAGSTMAEIWTDMLAIVDVYDEVLPWNIQIALVEDEEEAMRCMELLAPSPGLRMPLLAVRSPLRQSDVMGTLSANYMQQTVAAEMKPSIHMLDAARYWELVVRSEPEVTTLILFVDENSDEQFFQLQDMRELAKASEQDPTQFAHISKNQFPRLEQAFGIGGDRQAVLIDHHENIWWACEWGDGFHYEGMEGCLVDALSDGRSPSRLSSSIQPQAKKGARLVPLLSADELDALLSDELHQSLLILVEAPGCGFCSLLRNTVFSEIRKRIMSRLDSLPITILAVQQLDSSSTTLPDALPWKERVPRVLMAIPAPFDALMDDPTFIDFEGQLTLTSLVDFVLRNLPSGGDRQTQRSVLLQD